MCHGAKWNLMELCGTKWNLMDSRKHRVVTSYVYIMGTVIRRSHGQSNF